jgi:Lon protease-like protein
MPSDMPLFPLNTVLFPGAPIHLHIFEPRYQRMITTCLDEQRPFGVVLIRRGLEALGPLAEPHTVGCSAQITNVERLEGGRMNIVAIGQERFRILSLDSRAFPYLIGAIQTFPLEVDDPPGLARSGRRLRGQVIRLMRTQLSVLGQTLDPDSLPTDPIELAYLAASVLQISPEQKQKLLQVVHAEELLLQIQDIYRREQALVEGILAHGDRESDRPFSLN